MASLLGRQPFHINITYQSEMGEVVGGREAGKIMSSPKLRKRHGARLLLVRGECDFF